MNKIISYIKSKINNYEIYCFFITILAIIFWINPFFNVGMLIFSLILLYTVLKFNDLKYGLPCILFVSFLGSDNLAKNEGTSNVLLYVSGFISIIALGILFFRKKIKFKNILNNGYSKVGYLLMCVSALIPIFWTEGTNFTYYFVYFNWLLYLVIYIFCVNINDKNMQNELFTSLSFLGLLIAMQVMYTSFSDYSGFEKLFSTNASIGWGIYNEAGIMMLFCIPFIFCLLYNNVNKLVQIAKLFVILFGIILTNSRGSYLFGAILLVVVFLYYFIKKKMFKTMFIILFSAIICFITLYCTGIVQKVYEVVFKNGLDDSNRFLLFENACLVFTKSGRNVVFGGGMVCQFLKRDIIPNKWVDESIFAVYHSTFFETLACMGLFGMVGLIIHMYQKYSFLIKNRIKNSHFMLIVIGYVVIGLYGLIDNTYHMFYFMIPLAIVTGILESSVQKDNNENCQELITNEIINNEDRP